MTDIVVSMDDIIQRVKDKFDVTENSAKLYTRNFFNVMTKYDLSLNDMRSPDKVMPLIAELKPATQKVYIMSIIRLLDTFNRLTPTQMKKWEDEFTKKADEVERITSTKSISAPDIDIKKLENQLNKHIREVTNPRSKYQAHLKKVVFLLYTLIPARRAEDQYDMLISTTKTPDILADDDMKDNYYNKKQFIFKRYKTAKSSGTQVLDVPLRLKIAIGRMIRARTAVPTEPWLFVSTNGAKFIPSTWNRLLNSVFGKGISVNQLRKLYAKNNIDQSAVRVAGQIARDMGHQLTTALKYYYEQDELNCPEDED